MSKLWEWFDACELAAIRDNDPDRQRLAQIHHQFWENAEHNPQYTLMLTEQGIALARDLGEPWWELFHGYWRGEVLLFYLDKMTLALDAAVELMTKIRQPGYQNCPVNSDIQRLLIDAYVFIDPTGYEEKIITGIEYMEAHSDMDEDTRRLLHSRRVDLAEAHDNYDEAIEHAIVLLGMSQGDNYRQTHAYRMLAYCAYRNLDFVQAQLYNQEMVHHARIRNIQGSIAMAHLWTAYFEQRAGRDNTAELFYKQAMTRMMGLGASPGSDFYDIACAYHELCGNLDDALEIRDKQLAVLSGKGAWHDEALCYLARCKLLKSMKKDLTTEMTTARLHFKKLQKPALYLERLERIISKTSD
ncbi:MAG: hypothetical protein ACPG7F_10180 [Aggregatilineales bacterium]